MSRPKSTSASPEDSTPAMCFDRATLAYGGRVVWSELSLTVQSGEFLAVLGPNAALPPGQGGGSSNLRPDYAVTPIDGLRAALPGVEILANPADRVRPGWQLAVATEVQLPAEAGAAAVIGVAGRAALPSAR